MRVGTGKISQCRLGEMLFPDWGDSLSKGSEGWDGDGASHHECVEETDLP